MTVELKLGTLMRQVGPTNPRILIGRDEQSCELWIHDESVSRRHAEVYLQGNEVCIRDLGSSNGTWVNGQPLGPNPVALGPGMVVYVGHAPLGVEWTQAGGGKAATVMAALPPELMAMMAQRRQQQMTNRPADRGFAVDRGPGRVAGGPPGPAVADQHGRRRGRGRRRRRDPGSDPGRAELPLAGLEQQRDSADRATWRHLRQRQHHQRFPRVHRDRPRDRRVDLRRAGRAPQKGRSRRTSSSSATSVRSSCSPSTCCARPASPTSARTFRPRSTS